MTLQYDELLAELDAGSGGWYAEQAATAIRALTAQIVERDAVIERVRDELDRYDQSDEPEEYRECAPEDRWRLYRDLDAALSQVPRDALAARDAERDKTVRADAWDEGFAFGWHADQWRTTDNPYRADREENNTKENN